MALKLYERYPQLWESPSNDYPQGAFKNLSAQGETDGSYLEKDWLNDYSGFFGALLRNAEMTPDGTIDTAQRSQFYDALVKVAKSAVADQGYATTNYVDNKFNEVPKTEIINDRDQASDENVFSAAYINSVLDKPSGLDITPNNRNIKIGLDDFNVGNGSYGLVAIGKEALQDNDNVQHSIAIGEGAMRHTQNTRYNIAIGHESLLNAVGDRNIAIGSNSLRFNSSGYGNTALGRNCLQNSTKGYYNVAVGLGCLTSSSPVGLDGKTILNTSPLESNSQTAIGVNALNRSITSGNTALGMNAGKSVTISEGVFIGKDAGVMIDSSTGYTGKVYVSLTINSLTLVKVNETMLSITNDELAEVLQVGFVAEFNVTDFDRQFLKVKSVEGSMVVFESPTVPIRDNYTVKLVGYETLTRGSATRNTFIGTSAGKASTKGLNTFVGYDAGVSAAGDNCVAVGDSALASADGNRNTAIGKSAMQQVKGSFNTAVGYQSGNNANNNNSNDFFGNLAGANTPETVSNVSCFGNRSNVTGSNQVQLGNEDTTTYVYGTVQNRSDKRDKVEISESSLGLDFILKLKPSEYKWNYREWKGKKRGSRKHFGFIAQDVNEIIDSNVYGIVQDHSKNGGTDVLSIGYDEFIPILVKSIQEQQKKIEELEAKIV